MHKQILQNAAGEIAQTLLHDACSSKPDSARTTTISHVSSDTTSVSHVPSEAASRALPKSKLPPLSRLSLPPTPLPFSSPSTAPGLLCRLSCHLSLPPVAFPLPPSLFPPPVAAFPLPPSLFPPPVAAFPLPPSFFPPPAAAFLSLRLSSLLSLLPSLSLPPSFLLSSTAFPLLPLVAAFPLPPSFFPPPATAFPLPPSFIPPPAAAFPLLPSLFPPPASYPRCPPSFSPTCTALYPSPLFVASSGNVSSADVFSSIDNSILPSPAPTSPPHFQVPFESLSW